SDLLAVEIIRSLDLIARDYDGYEYGLPVMTHYDEMVDTVVALIRTPRGEGEAWRAFLDALDEFETAANLWADPEGPTAADMERLRQSRQRVIECARALAALRSEAQGEGPVGAVCANCGAPDAKIAGGELDPDEAVCSSECYDQLKELGCPQEHGGTYRPKPARRGEGGGEGD